MSGRHPSRRRFVALAPALLLVWSAPRATRIAGGRRGGRGRHPDPRPGIDASKVLPSDRVADQAVAPVFDMVREIPHVVDGIRCYCGCADVPGNYSLLSCYEADGMAQVCKICQAQGRLVHRLHTEGRTLAQIRDAIDAEFG